MFSAKNVLLILIVIGIFLLIPLITQVAWSYSMTPVFGIREITYLEALAFDILLSVFSKKEIKF